MHPDTDIGGVSWLVRPYRPRRRTVAAFLLAALALLTLAVLLTARAPAAPTPQAPPVGEKTLTIAPNCLIFLDGRIARLEDLPEGAEVMIETNARGQIVLIDATSPKK